MGRPERDNGYPARNESPAVPISLLNLSFPSCSSSGADSSSIRLPAMGGAVSRVGVWERSTHLGRHGWVDAPPPAGLNRTAWHRQGKTKARPGIHPNGIR